MRGLLVGVAGLLLMAAGPAPGPVAERPPAQPARDTVVGYHLVPATGEPIDVRVLLRGGSHALRMDLPDFTFMLAEPTMRQLTLVVPMERTALDLPWSDGPQPLFLVDEEKRYARKAEATIAGHRCTNWDAVGDRARSSICVTGDGVILRHVTFDPVGRRNLVEAFAVKAEAVPAAEFEVPQGFDRLGNAPR